MEDNEMLLEFVKVSLMGLLANGDVPSYDTAHKAFNMAQMMMGVKDQYMETVND